jgi:methionyl-tRNA formyltransferase
MPRDQRTRSHRIIMSASQISMQYLSNTNSTSRVALLGRRKTPFTGHIAQTLIDNGIHIAAILLDSKCPSEKDQRIWKERTDGRLAEIDITSFKDRNVSLVDVESHNGNDVVEYIREQEIDLALNAGTPRVLCAAVLDAPSLGTLNVHPGLLPLFRGATCVEWAIYLDQPVGNTVHYMSELIDEGPIVMAERCPVWDCRNYVDIRVAAYRHGFSLLALAARYVLETRTSKRDLPPQAEGKFYKPIDPEKMQEVIRKIENGSYVERLRADHGRAII